MAGLDLRRLVDRLPRIDQTRVDGHDGDRRVDDDGRRCIRRRCGCGELHGRGILVGSLCGKAEHARAQRERHVVHSLRPVREGLPRATKRDHVGDEGRSDPILVGTLATRFHNQATVVIAAHDRSSIGVGNSSRPW